jgi:hypothetical protein
VVAEGEVHGVRGEMEKRRKILVRCDQPGAGCKTIRAGPHCRSQVHDDGGGLFVKTRDAEAFYCTNQILVNAAINMNQWYRSMTISMPSTSI